MITNAQPSQKIANSIWQKASIVSWKAYVQCYLDLTNQHIHSFIQCDFIKTTANLLKCHGVAIEIFGVCLNPKGTLRKFFQLQNEGEEIHHSGRTILVEYSTHFSLSLIILQQITHKGSFLLEEKAMHIMFSKFSKLKT